MDANIPAAIASIAASIDDALVAGRPTAALRAELRRLEQEQRSAAAKAAAEERARRAEQEAAEQAEIDAKAAALAAEVRGADRSEARRAGAARADGGSPVSRRQHPDRRNRGLIR